MNCPQPIPVRLSSERVQLMCAAKGCTYRTPVVADYRTARQVFQNEHGERTVS